MFIGFGADDRAIYIILIQSAKTQAQIYNCGDERFDIR